MKHHASSHILLVGSNNQHGLALARQFKKAGHMVSSLPLQFPSAQDYSNAVTHHFPIRSPMAQLDTFCQQLIEICTDTDISHVVPVDDNALEILMAHYHTLGQHTTVCTPTPEVYEKAGNLKTILALADTLKIPTPNTALIDEISNAKAHNQPYPHYLRPVKKASILNSGLGRHSHYYNTTESEFNNTIRLTLASCPALIQPPINGVGIGLSIAADKGKIIAMSCQRDKTPNPGLKRQYRKTITAPDTLLKHSNALIKALNYSGIALIEWVENDGNYTLVNMVCRVNRSLSLAQKSRCNVALTYLQIHSNSPLNPPAKNGEEHHHTRPFDNLSLRDPMPHIMNGFCQIRQHNAAWIRKLKSKLRIPLTKWRYAISKSHVDINEIPAEKLLFVCKGNVIRSAFSAHFLSIKRGKPVASAGTALWRRRYAIYDGTKVAKSLYDLNMTEHMSTTVLDIPYHTLKQYHAIYVYDFENYHTMLDYYPGLRRQLRFLDARKIGPFLWPVAIPDPFKKPAAEFQKTFRRIAALLTNRI